MIRKTPGRYRYRRPSWTFPVVISVQSCTPESDQFVWFDDGIVPVFMRDIPADAIWEKVDDNTPLG